jgi:hypothetical protein
MITIKKKEFIQWDKVRCLTPDFEVITEKALRRRCIILDQQYTCFIIHVTPVTIIVEKYDMEKLEDKLARYMMSQEEITRDSLAKFCFSNKVEIYGQMYLEKTFQYLLEIGAEKWLRLENDIIGYFTKYSRIPKSSNVTDIVKIGNFC